MPLLKGKSKATIKKNFDEQRYGPKFAKTAKKSGKKAAIKQMGAIVLSTARKSKKKG